MMQKYKKSMLVRIDYGTNIDKTRLEATRAIICKKLFKIEQELNKIPLIRVHVDINPRREELFTVKCDACGKENEVEEESETCGYCGNILCY